MRRCCRVHIMRKEPCLVMIKHTNIEPGVREGCLDQCLFEHKKGELQQLVLFVEEEYWHSVDDVGEFGDGGRLWLEHGQDLWGVGGHVVHHKR